MSERAEAAECLELLIKRLMHGSDTQAMGALAERDLSFSQIRVLFTLSHGAGALAINELAALTAQSVATASRTVDALVRLGLLERAENPADRRVKLVSLSTAGRELVEWQTSQRRKAFRSFADELPQHQLHRLLEALRPIVAGLDPDSPEPPGSPEPHESERPHVRGQPGRRSAGRRRGR